MSVNINLTGLNYGVQINGFSYLLSETVFTKRWATLNIVPFKTEDHGDYQNTISLVLDEKTVRAIAKKLEGYIARFDAEIAELEADEADEADGE